MKKKTLKTEKNVEKKRDFKTSPTRKCTTAHSTTSTRKKNVQKAKIKAKPKVASAVKVKK